MKYFISLAGLLGLLAVAGGAFTSHGLDSILMKSGVPSESIPQRLEWATTAMDYLLIHSVALLACSLAAVQFPDAKAWRASCLLFLLGMLLFSGSLFALSWTGSSLFARTAPWGGTTLILGWLFVALSGLMVRRTES